MKQSPSTRSPCSQGGIRLISCWKLKQVATAMIARACIVAEHVHRSVVFARWRPYVPRRTRCSLSPRESSNCISIGSAVFAEFIRVTSQYRQTDRHTQATLCQDVCIGITRWRSSSPWLQPITLVSATYSVPIGRSHCELGRNEIGCDEVS